METGIRSEAHRSARIPEMNNLKNSNLTAWLQLLRLPNLFTVPGDPIAGFLLAGGLAGNSVKPVILCIFASLFFYAFGLILNDIFDLETDRKERPSRPLPAGRISLKHAWSAAILCAVAGLAVAFFAGSRTGIVAVVLLGAVISYDTKLKQIPVLGQLAMGLCRGLSFLIGVSVVGIPVSVNLIIVAAAGIVLYVACFSIVAANEMKSTGITSVRWLPFISVALCSLCLGYFYESGTMRSDFVPVSIAGLIALFAVIRTWVLGDILGESLSVHVPKIIGGYIQTLIIIQAGLCALSGVYGLLAALLLWGMMLLFSKATEIAYSS